MLKKYRKSGTSLSAMQLKEVKGGAGIEAGMFAQPCEDTSDCSNACFPGKPSGSYCFSGFCSYVRSCPNN